MNQYFIIALILLLVIVLFYLLPSIESFVSGKGEEIQTIQATVPLRVPLTCRDMSFIGQVDCTSDLDCDYPQKCCQKKCQPPHLSQDTKPDCRFIPMRIKTC